MELTNLTPGTYVGMYAADRLPAASLFKDGDYALVDGAYQKSDGVAWSALSGTYGVNPAGAIDGTALEAPTSVSGNAGTATVLQTARTINGTSFNGSANVTVTAAAGTLTGTTLAANVVASSLTQVGTLAALTVTAPIAGSITGNAATATSATTADSATTATSATTAGTVTTAAQPAITSVGTLAGITATLVDAADDAAAATATVPVGGLYHTSGAVKVRVA